MQGPDGGFRTTGVHDLRTDLQTASVRTGSLPSSFHWVRQRCIRPAIIAVIPLWLMSGGGRSSADLVIAVSIREVNRRSKCLLEA